MRKAARTHRHRTRHRPPRPGPARPARRHRPERVRHQRRHDGACYKSAVTDELRWVKSTRCGNNTCVEVAGNGEIVLMRDGKHPGQTPLGFSRDDWHGFLDTVAADPDAWR